MTTTNERVLTQDEQIDALGRYGKAKLKLKASIVENGNVAVDVTAAFVVSR